MSLHKYFIQVPVLYRKQPSCKENPQATKKLVWRIKEPYTMYVYHRDSDKVKVEIMGDGKDGIFVNFHDLLAESEERALEFVRGVLSDICIRLSYLMQNQLSFSFNFHSYFYWNDRDIIIKDLNPRENCQRFEDKQNHKVYLNLIDSIGVKDQMDSEVTYEIDFSNFEVLDACSMENSHIKFMLKSFYRALGNWDIASQYFKLFTIIEYLERNVMDENAVYTKKLIPDELQKCFLDEISNFVRKQDSMSKEMQKRTINRFNEIIKRATINSRAKKLQYLLQNRYGIYDVSCDGKESPLTVKKLQEFIEMRNFLFHSLKDKKTRKQDLSSLTKELFVLCQNIINKEINTNGQNS